MKLVGCLQADLKNLNTIGLWEKMIGEKISVHEISKQHIQAVEFRNIWSQNKTIDNQLETQINKEEALFRKNVLTQLIK